MGKGTVQIGKEIRKKDQLTPEKEKRKKEKGVGVGGRRPTPAEVRIGATGYVQD